MSSETFVQGRSLQELIERPAPFVTAFLGVDDNGSVSRPESFANLIETPGAARSLPSASIGGALEQLNKAVSDYTSDTDIEAAAFVTSTTDCTVFEFVEPIRRNIVRVGQVPSLGPILEAHQMIASHAVVTVENGRYGLTTFGSKAVPDDEARSLGIQETVETLMEQLRFAPPRLLAIAGPAADLESLAAKLGPQFPLTRIAHYPVTNLDTDLMEVADDVLRDATSIAAEDTANELAMFRAAEAEGLTVTGPSVIPAIESGIVSAVLVNDDLNDTRVWDDDRLPDVVIARALAAGVRLTMIPRVDDDRGPETGIGAVLAGTPVVADRQHESQRVARAPAV